jgi:hypothetical protein
MIRTAHPNGHFYSPVVDPEELKSRLEEIYPEAPVASGIDFQDATQLGLIDVIATHIHAYDYPEHGPTDDSLDHFYTQNSQFSWLDSRALFCFLRHWKPARVIEVGSGYSSLILSDVKRRFLPEMSIQCIEPYPRPFLRRDSKISLIEQRVQQVPLAMFESLKAGDLLFIDSSHVCKTGSDVNYLFLHVLPKLAPGVLIHVHDIFLPFEYLKEWVIDENRSWNEQYLLHALLMFSRGFEVQFGCYYSFWKFPNLIVSALNLPNGHGFGGGSFYFKRC